MDGETRPDLGRDLYEATAYIAHLESILHAIGAKRILGVWHFPNYYHDALHEESRGAREPVLLTPDRWVASQKEAARRLLRYEELLSIADDADCDRTSGDVLPDLDGQSSNRLKRLGKEDPI